MQCIVRKNVLVASSGVVQVQILLLMLGVVDVIGEGGSEDTI
jgi:hypothetical protein